MNQRSGSVVFDESFLSVRAKLLEISATLDRVDRAVEANAPLDEAALEQRERVDHAIRLLLSERSDRAENIQLLFSRRYRPNWRSDMAIDD
ncbi:hypothetical protein Q31b_26890 [Novipirellula aureliae]|uniref:Uncharacterized protein n=1 Tax=Novipirellula aureliae TaxID=2527966 RepID=A0A5C6DWX9_9BACT|nr:hypothetical protein [Novipirellula aureliae]TWU41250.1 hypothetical protein Q31b_26890 [Novipirellula aureliae]